MSLIDSVVSFAAKNYDQGIISADAISKSKSNVTKPSVDATIKMSDKPMQTFSIDKSGEDVKATRDKKLDAKTAIVIVAVVGAIGFIAMKKTEQKVRELENNAKK